MISFPMFPAFFLFLTLCSSSFEPSILFIFVHVPSVCTTNIAQHSTHTAHNIHNTQLHTAYNTHNTRHSTSHHITFCTCLVLILVVMATVSGQAVVVGTFQRRRRRHIVRFVPFSWISVGLRGFRPCGGKCLDPKDGELCLMRAHLRGGSQRY